MSQGSSFVGSVDAATRRGLLELDRRLAGVQATIAALSPAHSDLTGLGADDHPQYLLKTGGTVSGQTTFSAVDGVKITGTSGGIWFDDRNNDGSKYVLYHSGNFFGIWDGAQTHHRFYDSGRMDVTDGGDNNYIYFGPNGTWGGQLYVGATTDKAGTNTAAVISTDGNLHLDVGDGKTMYLNYYTQGRPINSYGDWNTNGYSITTNILTATGRIYPRNWIEFSEHEGLYSPLNGAHFYPNNASYGSWRVAGTRNSWQGLEFDTSNGQLSLMMTANGNWHTGVHANGSGWRWYFINQDLYCNAYRGFNNVAGTGNASYHPNGIYSTGTNWLYGTIYTNNSAIYAGPIYDYGTRVSREGHGHSGGMSGWDAGQGLAYGGATVGGGSPNRIGFRWASPFVNCTVDNVIAAGCANFSDRRIKTNINSYFSGLEAVRLLRPVTYSPLDVVSFDQETGEPIIGDGDPGADLVGFIADEVQEVVPSAVRGEGIELKSIDSVQLLSVVVSALKEIDQRVLALEGPNA